MKNPKYDGYQRRLASMVSNFFWWKTSGSKTSAMVSNKFACSAVKSEICQTKN